MRILCVVTLVFLLTSVAMADEIRLKSGEVLTNVKVIKENDARLIVRMLDGKRRTIKIEDIAERIKKPTLSDVFDEKVGKLKKKDLSGMIEIARWGLEQGVKKDALKLLNKVLRYDRKNVDARELLGHKLVDGKWLSGSSLKRALAKAHIAQMRAKGWVKDKKTGEYVDPYTFKCLAAGLIKKDGEWHTKSDCKELEKGNTFIEGQWYTPEEMKKCNAGFRRVGKEWKSIIDLNREHRDATNPWILESNHFVIIGTVNHKALTKSLSEMEAIWEPMVKLFGNAPLTATMETKPKVIVLKTLESYKLAGSKAAGERAAAYSSSTGFFYEAAEKATFTYYHDAAHLREWCRAGAALAFMGSIADMERLKAPMCEALGSYFGSHMGGKYYPQWSIFWYLKTVSYQSPRKAFADFKYSDRESGFAGVGFAIHYLVENYPDAVAAWMPKFLTRGSSFKDLLDPIEKSAGNDLRKSIREAHSEFKKNYKQIRED